MMPELFALNPDRPVVLSMVGSVGQGGMNRVDDVTLVQRLLNATSFLGTPLKVDGFSGPKTVGAIKGYQGSVSGLVPDGRVDPRGKTIRTLVSTLQTSGSLPVPAPGLALAEPKDVKAFQGVGSRFGLPFTESSWSIASSSSIDASIKDNGLYVANLVLVDDNAPNVQHKVTLRTFLKGVSIGLPVGFDISLPSFPSIGGRIYRGLGGVGPLFAGSFAGLVGVAMVSGNSIGGGLGVTLYQFGWLPVGPPGSYVGAAAIAGIQGGLPGYGAAAGSGLCTPV